MAPQKRFGRTVGRPAAAHADWVPMRWPTAWQEPTSLDLVLGTPVNCLVVPAAERQKLSALFERGRQAGLTFLELDLGGQPGQAAPPARRSEVRWDSPAPVLAITDNVWPKIQASESGRAEAGPTGIPWVDSNGWFASLARVRAPEKTIWLVFSPPAKPEMVTPEAYVLAIADCEAFGARWVLSLGDSLQAGLAARKPDALAAWKKISGALAFFQKHRTWKALQPRAAVGVLSDFSGRNEHLAGETLNLMARRHLPYRILLRSRGAEARTADDTKRSSAPLPFTGLKAIVYPDQEAPDATLRLKLLAFVESGGLLITGPAWGTPQGSPSPGDNPKGYDVRTAGKGRLAIPKQAFDDPYLLAQETHLLLSRRNDVLRSWNAGTTNLLYSTSPDGNRSLVQIVNYATRPAGHPISIWLREPNRSARLWTLDKPQPQPLELAPEQAGVEFHLPPLGVYAAVELER